MAKELAFVSATIKGKLLLVLLFQPGVLVNVLSKVEHRFSLNSPRRDYELLTSIFNTKKSLFSTINRSITWSKGFSYDNLFLITTAWRLVFNPVFAWSCQRFFYGNFWDPSLLSGTKGLWLFLVISQRRNFLQHYYSAAGKIFKE